MTKPRRTVLGSIPKGIDPSLREYLARLAEHVEVATGGGRTGLQRFVTIEDLVGLDLAKYVIRNKNTAVNSLLGGSAELEPVTSAPDLTAPKALTDLQGASTSRSIVLTWDGTQFANYSYTEVWRAEVDDFGQAILAGTSQGRIYVDANVVSDVTYFYWVRAISIYAEAPPGPINATAGTEITVGLITDDDIDTVAAEKLFVVSGTLADVIIGLGHITNAMIGQIIQADNYDPVNHIGWQVNKAGDAEFNNIKIYDESNGSLIFQTGVGTPTPGFDWNYVLGPDSDAIKDIVPNVGNKISDINISTYIKVGAILEAYIGDAQVGTLKIKENSVVVPVSAYTSGQYSLPAVNTWYTVGQATIDADGQPIQAIFSFAYDIFASAGYEESDNIVLQVRVYRDSTANMVYSEEDIDVAEDPDGSTISSYYVGPGQNNFGVFCAALKDTPSDGNHTYFVQAKANVTGSSGNAWNTVTRHAYITRRSIVMLGVKR